MARPFLPESAVTWLVGSEPKRVLVLGAAGPYATAIREQGHAVLVLDREPAALGRLIDHRPDLGGVVAQAESMPFDSQQFDRVVCPQNLHSFAPGTRTRAISARTSPGANEWRFCGQTTLSNCCESNGIDSACATTPPRSGRWSMSRPRAAGSRSRTSTAWPCSRMAVAYGPAAPSTSTRLGSEPTSHVTADSGRKGRAMTEC